MAKVIMQLIDMVVSGPLSRHIFKVFIPFNKCLAVSKTSV